MMRPSRDAPEGFSDGHVGRACGKLILLGEHAVVYGTPALVAGIPQGATARARLAAPTEPSRLFLNAGGGAAGGRFASGTDPDVSRAFQGALETVNPLPPVAVDAETDLPPGGGLGCSAALGVAVVRAVLQAAGRATDPDEVHARAMAWERVFHGNPSGIDATAAALGGCFEYRRPASVRSLLLPSPLTLVVASSGVSSSTRDMVEGLAERRRRDPASVEANLAEIARLVERGRHAMEAGDLVELARCMTENQVVLHALGLSSSVLDGLCALARNAGALGAKLTGKGGGGAVIALCHGESAAQAVLAAVRGAGFHGFITEVATHRAES
jgi:mevalonate kinase